MGDSRPRRSRPGWYFESDQRCGSLTSRGRHGARHGADPHTKRASADSLSNDRYTKRERKVMPMMMGGASRGLVVLACLALVAGAHATKAKSDAFQKDLEALAEDIHQKYNASFS